jgi:formylglycine-generating enzyme required for sulfatase activity
MLMIPSGSFMMGAPVGESGSTKAERPRHLVTIHRPFAVGRFAVTVGEFSAFVRATNHDFAKNAVSHLGRSKETEGVSFLNPGFPQTDRSPVVCVSWEDACAYANWVAEITGKSYRLLSEAEWEYVFRAGTTSAHWWGSTFVEQQFELGTVAVDSHEPNPWGLYNILGNVWEWVQDLWHDTYQSAPTDGSAWIEGASERRVVRGAAWTANSGRLRYARRSWPLYDLPEDNIGFRLARSV